MRIKTDSPQSNSASNPLLCYNSSIEGMFCLLKRHTRLGNQYRRQLCPKRSTDPDLCACLMQDHNHIATKKNPHVRAEGVNDGFGAVCIMCLLRFFLLLIARAHHHRTFAIDYVTTCFVLPLLFFTCYDVVRSSCRVRTTQKPDKTIVIISARATPRQGHTRRGATIRSDRRSPGMA